MVKGAVGAVALTRGVGDNWLVSRPTSKGPSRGKMEERESTVFNGLFTLSQSTAPAMAPAGTYRALVSLRGGPRILLFQVAPNAPPPFAVLTISCENARVKCEVGKVRVNLDAAPFPTQTPTGVQEASWDPRLDRYGQAFSGVAASPVVVPLAEEPGGAAPQAPPDSRDLAAAARAALPRTLIRPPTPVSFLLSRSVLHDDAENNVTRRARWNRFALLLGVCWDPVRDRMQAVGLAARARPGDGTLVPSTHMRSTAHELGSPRGRRASLGGASSAHSTGSAPPRRRRCRSAEAPRAAYGRALFAPSRALLDPSSPFLLPSTLFQGIDTPGGRWQDAVKALTDILQVARASGGESPTYEQRHNLSRRQYKYRIFREAISRWTAAVSTAQVGAHNGPVGGGGRGWPDRNWPRRGGGRPMGASEAPWRRAAGGEEWRGAGGGAGRQAESRGGRGGGEPGRAWGLPFPGHFPGGQQQQYDNWYPGNVQSPRRSPPPQEGGYNSAGYGWQGVPSERSYWYPPPPPWNEGQVPQGYDARGAGGGYYPAPQAWDAALEHAGQSAAAWAYIAAALRDGGHAAWAAGMHPGPTAHPAIAPYNGGPQLTVMAPVQQGGPVTPPPYMSAPSTPHRGVAYAVQLVSTPRLGNPPDSFHRLPEVEMQHDGPFPVPEAERGPARAAQRGEPPAAAKPRAP